MLGLVVVGVLLFVASACATDDDVFYVKLFHILQIVVRIKYITGKLLLNSEIHTTVLHYAQSASKYDFPAFTIRFKIAT